MGHLSVAPMRATGAEEADTHEVTTPLPTTPTLSVLIRRWRDRSRVVVDRWRRYAVENLRAVPAPDWDDIDLIADADGVAHLDDEAQAWVQAHQSALPVDAGENTALIFADSAVQQWMATTLRDLNWIVTEPVMVSEGWVPARGESTATGQPATTFTTASKTFTHARRTDPTTAQKAGAAAAANLHITVTSHLGRLLFAYQSQHQSAPGVGLTAAEAVNAAGLLTDGATGSPWRRVTDLRDMGLLTVLLDGTGMRVTRKNESNTDGGVLVVTPLGLRAAAALRALDEHGFPDYPLDFDGPTEPTLFEELPATLARIALLGETDESAATPVDDDTDAGTADHVMA